MPADDPGRAPFSLGRAFYATRTCRRRCAALLGEVTTRPLRASDLTALATEATWVVVAPWGMNGPGVAVPNTFATKVLVDILASGTSASTSRMARSTRPRPLLTGVSVLFLKARIPYRRSRT
jgi:hypothetical protein